jgi:hypothetical protein
MLVAAIIFMIAGFTGRGDSGPVLAAGGIGMGATVAVYAAAASAIQRLQARIAELEKASAGPNA